MMRPPPATLDFPALDRWLQRLAAAAMLALALFLVGVGFALYAPRSAPQPLPSLTGKETAP